MRSRLVLRSGRRPRPIPSSRVARSERRKFALVFCDERPTDRKTALPPRKLRANGSDTRFREKSILFGIHIVCLEQKGCQMLDRGLPPRPDITEPLVRIVGSDRDAIQQQGARNCEVRGAAEISEDGWSAASHRLGDAETKPFRARRADCEINAAVHGCQRLLVHCGQTLVYGNSVGVILGNSESLPDANTIWNRQRFHYADTHQDQFGIWLRWMECSPCLEHDVEAFTILITREP